MGWCSAFSANTGESQLCFCAKAHWQTVRVLCKHPSFGVGLDRLPDWRDWVYRDESKLDRITGTLPYGVRWLATAFATGACPRWRLLCPPQGQAPAVKAAASRRTPYSNATATAMCQYQVKALYVKSVGQLQVKIPYLFPFRPFRAGECNNKRIYHNALSLRLQLNHGKSNLTSSKGNGCWCCSKLWFFDSHGELPWHPVAKIHFFAGMFCTLVQSISLKIS